MRHAITSPVRGGFHGQRAHRTVGLLAVATVLGTQAAPAYAFAPAAHPPVAVHAPVAAGASATSGASVHLDTVSRVPRVGGAAALPAGRHAASRSAAPVEPPTDVQLTSDVHGLTVSWTASQTPGVTRYIATATPVSPGTARGCETTAADPLVTPAATTCPITDLDYQEYEVSVVAVVLTTESEPASANGYPLPERPDPPTGLAATVSGGSIVATWNPVASAYGVPIKYMAAASTTDWGVGCWDAPRDALTCTFADLPPAIPFLITAYAIGEEQSEAASLAGRVTIPLPATAPAGPPLNSDVGDELTPGTTITLSGDGYMPGGPVLVALYSRPVVLVDDIKAGLDGTFSATVRVPASYVGAHTFLASGPKPDGRVRFLTLPVRIAADQDDGGGGGGGGDDNDGNGEGLPRTGSPVVLLLLIGVGLVTTGGMARFGPHRRRTGNTNR